MKILVGHVVQCFFEFRIVIADLWESKSFHTSSYCGIKLVSACHQQKILSTSTFLFFRHLFWSSEENPSDDHLVNQKGRSVFVHQPLLILCGAITHICYCLQTLYFFKPGPVSIILKIDGIDQNCDQHISKYALEHLDALVSSIISDILWKRVKNSFLRFKFSLLLKKIVANRRTPSTQVTVSLRKRWSIFLFFHKLSFSFTLTFQICFASAVESLFDLCLRIRVFPVVHVCALRIATL
jgi:hypothetical protein